MISQRRALETGNRSRKSKGQRSGTTGAMYTVRTGLVLALLFSALLLVYVTHASRDVVFSDYIRLVNSYLPDPLKPESFFTPDILTRIPLTYLVRWVNVRLFSYSVHFDRVLGILGLFLSSVVILMYAGRERTPAVILLPVLLLLFSLNKWEMLLNGSGYAHFLAFACFYWNFLIADRIYTGTEKRHDRLLMVLLPWLTLLTAGPYIAVYLVTMILCGLWTGLREHKNTVFWIVSSVLVLGLYFLSNHYAVYEYSGARDVSFREVLTQYPGFAIHFFLNGFASMLLGGEVLEELLKGAVLGYWGIYLLGAFVLFSYAAAWVLYVYRGYWKRTLFPALLMLYGLGSHAIVFLSRYIFLNETYAWQSRYALQYQSGILGILLVLGLYIREERRAQKGLRKSAFILITLLLPLTFALGNCYTTSREIRKMPYRLASFERMESAALDPEEYSDEELETVFEYHHGGDRIRHALDILREHHLNVYKKYSEVEIQEAA